MVAKAEIEKRIEASPVPNFLATFLRQKWQGTLEHVYLAQGEESDSWESGVTTLEDLVWSVQPKRSPEDRRHLVALLPSLLKRLSAGMQSRGWAADERESFMANLVEAHAAAVKPSLSQVGSPTAAVAEAARAQAELAKAAGDDARAAKAEALADAMAQAEPEPVEAEREVIADDYLEIARSLERGMWIEFEAEDGQLAFAKLAWVSPLRGTYLFTNRQGQKALSMTAEELAERFRADRARVVEAEPLIDRAFTSMITQIEQKFPEPRTRPLGSAAVPSRWSSARSSSATRSCRASGRTVTSRTSSRRSPRAASRSTTRTTSATTATGSPRSCATRSRAAISCSPSAASARRPTTTRGRPRRRRSACRSCAIPKRWRSSKRASAPTRIRTAC